MEEKTFRFSAADSGRSGYDCADGETALCAGARFAPDGTLVPLAPDAFEGAAPHPGVCDTRRYTVTATDQGLRYRSRPAGEDLGEAPACPVIEYGMRKVSALNCHDIITLSDSVAALYRRVLAEQAESKGLFTRPFMLRHALRLTDGSHIALSSPVLMLPWVIPPCLGVTTHSSDEGRAQIQVDFNNCPLFSLRYRVVTGVDQRWRDHVEALDIFISPEMETCLADGGSQARITTYASVARGANSGRRGRDGQETSTFAGRYSVADDNFTDHTLEELGIGALDVWHVTANPRLPDDIRRVSDFRRIASIPFDALAPSEGFADLPLDTTDFSRLGESPALADTSRIYECVKATALCVSADRLHAVVKSLTPPVPAPLPRPCGDVELTVVTKAEGVYAASRAVHNAPGAPLHEDFPRYIYHADPSAVAIHISQGGRRWSLPLTRHDTLKGAYWFAGLGADPLPPETGADAPELPCTVHISDRLLVSASDCPMRIEAETTVGDGAISCVCPAIGSASQGQLGDFPLYAFTGGGIYLLRHTSPGVYAPPALVSTLAARSAVPMRAAVCALTASGLLIIKGTRCDLVPYPAADIPDLPGYSTSWAPPETSEATLAYDAARDLVALVAEGAPTWIYDPAARSWSVTGAGGGVAEIVTRPVKADGLGTLKTAVSVSLIGDFRRRGSALRLYGSDDMKRWRLLSATKGPATGAVYGRPCRAFILAATVPLGDGDCLYGARLVYQRR